MAIARFHVDLEVGRPPQVTVNGEVLDPSVFLLAGVRTDPGALPALVLEVQGEGTIEGEGVVIATQERAEADAIVEFLDRVDLDQLDRDSMKVMDDPEFRDNGSLCAPLVEAMRRMLGVTKQRAPASPPPERTFTYT